MKLYKNKNGFIRMKLEDTDNYEVTEDNGVDFHPTKEQIRKIARVFSKAGAP